MTSISFVRLNAFGRFFFNASRHIFLRLAVMFVVILGFSNFGCPGAYAEETYFATGVTIGSSGTADGQFKGLEDIAMDSSDNIYTIESTNGRLQKFDSTGGHVWTTTGPSGAELGYPVGLGTDSADNIYVAVSGSHNIRVFNSSGSVTTVIGSGPGDTDYTFTNPGDVAVDSTGNIYVADSGNMKVKKYDSDRTFAWSKNFSPYYPVSLFVDSSDNLYVAVNTYDVDATGYIGKYDSGGTSTGTFTSNIDDPWKVTVYNGNLFIIDGGNVAKKIDISFNALAQWSAAGTKGIAVTSADKVLIGRSTQILEYEQCSLTLTPASSSPGGQDALYGIDITFNDSSCPWTFSSNVSWITSTGSKSGSDTFGYTAAANTGVARTGTVTAGGYTYTVTQTAGPCSYSLNPASKTFADYTVSSSSVSINRTHTECAMSASSNDTWITGVSVTGTTVNYSVAENRSSAERTGYITISGQTHTVVQPGRTCTYSINSGGENFGPSGGTKTVTVTASASGCDWSVQSNAGWIQITDNQSGSENASVSYSVDMYSSASNREGTISVTGGNTFTVYQFGCSYSLTPSSESFTAQGGQGSFDITTEAGCPWSAAVSTGSTYTSIDGGSLSGTGSSAVNYTVAQNPTDAQRNSRIRVNSAYDYDITQNGQSGQMARKSVYIGANDWILNVYTVGSATAYEVYLVVRDSRNNDVPFNQIPAYMSAGHLCTANPCLIEPDAQSPVVSLVYDNGTAYVHHDSGGAPVVTHIRIE